jgi:hypothetical protein
MVGQGLFPFDASNDAYKLGVNYHDLRHDALRRGGNGGNGGNGFTQSNEGTKEISLFLCFSV